MSYLYVSEIIEKVAKQQIKSFFAPEIQLEPDRVRAKHLFVDK